MQVSPLVEKMTERRLIRPTQGRQGEYMKSVFLPFSSTGIYSVLTGNSIYFQADNVLTSKNVIITGIEFVDFATNNTLDTPQGSRVTIANTEATLGFFVLSNAKREIIAQIPLNCLILRLNGGRPTFTYWDDFSWENSSIYFSSSSAASAINGAWFKVFYNKK